MCRSTTRVPTPPFCSDGFDSPDPPDHWGRLRTQPLQRIACKIREASMLKRGGYATGRADSSDKLPQTQRVLRVWPTHLQRRTDTVARWRICGESHCARTPREFSLSTSDHLSKARRLGPPSPAIQPNNCDALLISILPFSLRKT